MRVTLRTSVLAILIALIAGTLLTWPATAAPSATISASRTSAIAGESARISGALGSRVARPVKLQRRVGTTWATIKKARSTNRGKYAFTVVVTGAAGARSTYRVLAPRVRRHAAVATASRTITVVAQTASLTGPNRVTVAKAFTVTATLRPVRPGRVTILQRLSGSTWTEVKRGAQRANGTTDFSVTPANVGIQKLRAVAAASGGAPARSSAPISVKVLPPALQRLSESSTGTPGDGSSYFSAIDHAGRYVAFSSSATTLVPSDTNGFDDIFVRDLETQEVERVSVSSTGVQANGSSEAGSISADGRYVAFASGASNLVAGDTNTKADIFVRDRVAGTTTRVSIDSDGGQSDGASAFPKISANGAYVTYHSDATDLVPGDTEGKRDVFVWSEASHSVLRVSQGPSDAGGNLPSSVPAISADGRYVTYMSDSNNLTAIDTNGLTDIFRWDRSTGQNEVVSLSPAGLQGSPADCWSATISADGRYVAFGARGFPVGPGDTASSFDIFVRDTVAGTTRRISQTPAGVNGNGESWVPMISGNGTTVAFTTQATNLGGTDTNGTYDLYARDLTR